jgi:hypothetical protein
MEGSMLKAIIEHDVVDGILFQYPPTKGDPISPHRHKGARTTLRHEKRLIPGLRWTGQYSQSIGYQ